MQRINSINGLFHEGNPATGQKGTKVTQEFLNSIQEELANAVEGGGVELDPTKSDQLVTLLKSGKFADVVYASAYPTLAEADAAAVAAQKKLVISTVWDVAALLELSASIKVIKGGGFNQSATLTLKGSFTTGLDQVFFGAGAVILKKTYKVFPQWWGTPMDGVLLDTTAMERAYACAVASAGEMKIPAGTYKAKITFDGRAPVKGAGIDRTIITPSDASAGSYCVRLFGAAELTGSLGSALSHLTIRNYDGTVTGTGTGTGLLVGNSATGLGFSNGLVEKINIRGFYDGLLINSAVMCEFKHIYSTNNTYGIRMDNENNVTANKFSSCRFRENTYGGLLNAGTVAEFSVCNWESNVQKNLWLQGSTTQGPTKMIFNCCWLEALTGNGTLISLHLDRGTGAVTKPMDVIFNRCNITCNEAGAPNGTGYDIYAERAQNVIFDHCIFSAEFNATRFGYNPANNDVRVWLRNCSTTQAIPTEALYANMPALTRVQGGVFGFFYDFTQTNGKTFNNYKVLSIAADQTDLQIAYVEVLRIDTAAGNVSINSFIGGSNGQRLKVIKTSTANTANLVHNGAGTEKIFAKSGGTVSLIDRRGADLVQYGGTWYEASAA